MKKAKIFVYAICKNEEAFIDRWMDSVSEADGVVVVDTGSTDDTVAKLQARGAIVYEETFEPWRFDSARNAALSHVPEDVDICVSNDIDEVFVPGWRQLLEQAWDETCTRARYWFVWERGSDNTPEKKFGMEKVHKRHNYKWVHPVHEVLEYNGTQPEKTIFIDEILLIHKPDPHKSRAQYLPLLELSSKENPSDDRAKFWLGREYIFNQRFEEGIKTLQEHLLLPTALWKEERSASMRFISRGYRELKDDYNAYIWLMRAVAECDSIREPWLELAQFAYDVGNWSLLYWAAKKGLLVQNSTNSYLVEPRAWGFLLDDYAGIGAFRLGFLEDACEHAKVAHKMAPNDMRLKNNLQIVQQILDGSKEDE